ncbi:hypothetical protein T06_10547 [Trichinella sp. T6]|nr:hypothetical protein T06_10547 [Trichinella sp. T6]
MRSLKNIVYPLLYIVSEALLKLPYSKNICAYTLYLPYLKTVFDIVGKGYEVSVLDEAPNVPDGQVEREKIPVEYAAFPFGICKLPTEQGKRLPAVVDQLFQHSTDGGTGCIHCNCRHCVWNNIVAFANASSV